ncbi:MAG: hypothetical protein ACJ8DC_08980 [Gemmatimonadales bacterium]
MKWLFPEPERDPRLAAALRRIDPTPDLSEEEALRLRILQAVRGMSQGLNAGPPRWWEWISSWIPVAVPMGVTACLAAALLLRATGESPAASVYSAETAADSAMVLATFSDAGFGNQVTAQLIAPEGDDWLLAEVIVR